MEKLKVAVVGLGRMGAEPSSRLQGKVPAGWLPISHTEAALHTGELEVVAFCDNDPARLERLGAYYNVKELYSDYREMLRAETPDMLCIATRTEGRTEIIKEAVSNGVKILYFEKPISRSVADCRETLALCKEHHVIAGYGVNRRYHDAYRQAKEIINSGRLGNLREILVEHGRSSLYWSHPHSVDLILYFSEATGFEFLQSTCLFTSEPLSHDLIDDDPIILNAFIKLNNGITACISQSPGLNIQLICESGVLRINKDGEKIQIYEGQGYLNLTEEIIPEVRNSATVNAFTSLLHAYRGSCQLPIEMNEIELGMELLNGIVYSSLHEGRRITPSEIPERMLITGRTGNYYA